MLRHTVLSERLFLETAAIVWDLYSFKNISSIHRQVSEGISLGKDISHFCMLAEQSV